MLIMVTISLFFFTINRNSIWHNELTLLADNAFKSKHNARVRNNFGAHLKDKGFLEEALIELLYALKIDSNIYEAYNNIGLIYREKKDYDLAFKYIEKAIALRPRQFEMQYNIAVLYDETGDRKKALYWYRRFLSVVPGSYDYQINYAKKRIGIISK